ncbi:MAG: ferrous iron transporter B, partial [Anaerolineae bacterium]|nr:ferrous iron transporter B [Anaerolineae bacterium]
LQVLEITDRVVVALNLIDEAKRHGLAVDERRLSRDLGVPVIPMAARQGAGVPELLGAIAEVAAGTYQTKPRRINYVDPTVESAVEGLRAQVESLFPDIPNSRWVAMRLLDGDASILKAVQEGTLGHLTQTNPVLPNPFVALEAVS